MLLWVARRVSVLAQRSVRALRRRERRGAILAECDPAAALGAFLPTCSVPDSGRSAPTRFRRGSQG